MARRKRCANCYVCNIQDCPLDKPTVPKQDASQIIPPQPAKKPADQNQPERPPQQERK